MYKLDAEGKVTKLKDSPSQLDSTDRFCITADPVSGEYLVLSNGSKKAVDSKTGLFGYDVLKDEWRLIQKSFPLSCYKIVTPVAEHGVVVFVGRKPYSVWLYKHATPTIGKQTAKKAR